MFIGPNPNSNCSLRSLVMDPWCNSSMSFLKDRLVQLTLAVQRFDGWPEHFQGINSELAGKSDNLMSATSSHHSKRRKMLITIQLERGSCLVASRISKNPIRGRVHL